MQATAYHKGEHVAETGLLPKDASCPLCGYTGSRRPVLTLQSNPRVDLLACRCQCLSASQMPDSKVLAAYYGKYYSTIDGTATFDGGDRLPKHIFRSLKMPARDTVRILDFGGGIDAVISRSLAQHFMAAGSKRVAITLVDYNANCPREWGNVTVECHQNLTDVHGEFEVVVASAVIEHIPYPREVLLSLLNSMVPGGRAYFRTPAVSSMIRLAAKLGVHIDFTFPAHVHDMGQGFWENVVSHLGMSDRYRLVLSRPSVVETGLRENPARTLMAYAAKAPWYVLGRRYTLVGGWEAVFERTA